MNLRKPGRYFVQFVNSDRRGTREHHYYVNASSPDEAAEACLRGLSPFERLKICDSQTTRGAMRL